MGRVAILVVLFVVRAAWPPAAVGRRVTRVVDGDALDLRYGRRR